MIKNLFIPESVRGYYFFPVRIVGFDIGKTTVKATQILCKKKEMIIERCFEESIQATVATDYQERASAAIKIILEQVGNYDHIISAISSTQAVFKELKVPFIGLETIKKVIGYEVEPLLPFSLNDAVLDCIVTKEIPEEKSSEVLVAAVQNQYMAQHLALFEAAGVQPERVTIDLFAFYGLYSLIPAYANQQGGIVLLEIEPQSTRMAYLYNGQLRFIRTLPKGLLDQAHLVAQNLKISDQEAFENIIRFGLESDHDETSIAVIKQALTNFFNDIIFTLQSFASKSKPAQSINKIIIFGTSATIRGLPQLVTDLAHIKSETFQINSLIHNGFGVSAQASIPPANMVSLATALPISTTAKFNLRQKDFALSQGKDFMKQLITGCGLLALILGALLGNALWQTHTLKRDAYYSEQEAVALLKEKVKKIPEDATNLDEVLSSAKTQIDREEKVWSAFSATARQHFLEYLIELSKVNKTELGLEVEKLSITPETIILKGRVRGYDDLRKLERTLEESKLFSFVERSPDPNFTTNGKRIRIAKKPGQRRNT
jgi:type IV pilus assembly protein PilM